MFGKRLADRRKLPNDVRHGPVFGRGLQGRLCPAGRGGWTARHDRGMVARASFQPSAGFRAWRGAGDCSGDIDRWAVRLGARRQNPRLPRRPNLSGFPPRASHVGGLPPLPLERLLKAAQRLRPQLQVRRSRLPIPRSIGPSASYLELCRNSHEARLRAHATASSASCSQVPS